ASTSSRRPSSSSNCARATAIVSASPVRPCAPTNSAACSYSESAAAGPSCSHRTAARLLCSTAASRPRPSSISSSRPRLISPSPARVGAPLEEEDRLLECGRGLARRARLSGGLCQSCEDLREQRLVLGRQAACAIEQRKCLRGLEAERALPGDESVTRDDRRE